MNTLQQFAAQLANDCCRLAIETGPQWPDGVAVGHQDGCQDLLHERLAKIRSESQDDNFMRFLVYIMLRELRALEDKKGELV